MHHRPEPDKLVFVHHNRQLCPRPTGPLRMTSSGNPSAALSAQTWMRSTRIWTSRLARFDRPVHCLPVHCPHLVVPTNALCTALCTAYLCTALCTVYLCTVLTSLCLPERSLCLPPGRRAGTCSSPHHGACPARPNAPRPPGSRLGAGQQGQVRRSEGRRVTADSVGPLTHHRGEVDLGAQEGQEVPAPRGLALGVRLRL